MESLAARKWLLAILMSSLALTGASCAGHTNPISSSLAGSQVYDIGQLIQARDQLDGKTVIVAGYIHPFRLPSGRWDYFFTAATEVSADRREGHCDARDGKSVEVNFREDALPEQSQFVRRGDDNYFRMVIVTGSFEKDVEDIGVNGLFIDFNGGIYDAKIIEYRPEWCATHPF